ncbi:MAG: ArsR family transcriptional regulator [Nitrosopumilus sp.]|nr:ArsR family transcriptional regulator [Nitrosopumilus sp.]MDH3825521.1 ArsR family transcriptional regulator [Nitrosopumilus sp.]
MTQSTLEELSNEREVLTQELNQSYLDAIVDENSRKLLDSIIDIPKSVLEISIETKIPLRTVYRKIQGLNDARLVKISGSVTQSGRKYFLYRSKIRSIMVTYHKNHFSVKIT